MAPKISVILHTARVDFPYPDDKYRHVIGGLVDDLEQQTFEDFELVVCDVARRDYNRCWPKFPLTVVEPLNTLWTRNRLCAISTAKNSALVHCRGELVVQFDDTAYIPKNYLQVVWDGWKEHKVCISGTYGWDAGDYRLNPGERARRARPGEIWGFCSFPLQVALELGGYDQAYDGARGLEDADWSYRLGWYGVDMGLYNFVPDGFRLARPKGPTDPRAVYHGGGEPIVGCCNRTWVLQRRRNILVANRAEDWEDLEAREFLLGPCQLLSKDLKCLAPNNPNPCPYIGKGFVRRRHELAAQILTEEPPPMVLDMANLRKEMGIE